MDKWFSVNAIDAWSAAQFAAQKDIRYYLNGFLVDPETKMCVGADGRMMGLAKTDIGGNLSRQTILYFSKQHLIMMKRRKNGTLFVFPINENLCKLVITKRKIDELPDETDVYNNLLQEEGAVSGHTNIIVGQFPDYKAVLKSKRNNKASEDLPIFDPKFIATCTTVMDVRTPRFGGALFHQSSPEDAMLVMSYDKTFMCVIMPMVGKTRIKAISPEAWVGSPD